MDKRPNIFLVGLMAVGKTTIGRLLANALHMHFYDSDHEIEFRDREEQVIDDLSCRQNIVLATGGGAVLREANRQHLAARGVVIHLDSPIDRLVERTSKDRKRPLLQNGDPRQTLTRLMNDRAPLYAEVRDYCFLTDRQSPKSLARHIEDTLRSDGVID